MERVCFLLRVRPDRLDEYRERHRAVWPEMRDALSATGWRNYSLFLRDDGLLVGYLETDDFAAAQRGDGGRPASTRAGRPRWPSSSSCRRASGRTPASRAFRRSSTLPDAPAYAAVDLGAESGRVVLGRLDGERVDLDVVHRFANRPVRLPDGLRWNLLALFTETLDGLRRAAAAPSGALAGVGVDAWGVDYALLDGGRRVLGLPFHYRDGRTDGMVARAHERVPRGRPLRRHRHPDDADQHGLPTARRRGVARRWPPPSTSRWSRT